MGETQGSWEGWSKALKMRLADVYALHPGASPELVDDIVHAVLAACDGTSGAKGHVVLAELETLGEVIARAREEIGLLETHDINGRHIPAATDELDAIVVHTAEATNAILETCETLDDVAGALDGAMSSTLLAATSRIYEACSFQDIVGQRISKVVTTLKMIDAKVGRLQAALSENPGLRAVVTEEPFVSAPSFEQTNLLNGPQLAASAMAQEDIDKLLAAFD